MRGRARALGVKAIWLGDSALTSRVCGFSFEALVSGFRL